MLIKNKSLYNLRSCSNYSYSTVNNAGLGILGVLECVPINMAKEIFEVNFFGALRLVQAVLPSMKTRQSGLIIQNSSHFGFVGNPFNELYCASKFALEGLTEALVPTLLHFNIRSVSLVILLFVMRSKCCPIR